MLIDKMIIKFINMEKIHNKNHIFMEKHKKIG